MLSALKFVFRGYLVEIESLSMDYFSHSEVPSLCLMDIERTMTFKQSIHQTVRPGDTVLDAGAGSGILAFFAAQAGARKVIAVEVDQGLAHLIRQNAELNGLADVVEVICADVRDLPIADHVDVVIAEMIETWLLDELQIPALNALRRSGVISDRTKIIPQAYRAEISFGAVNFHRYGFEIPFPIHNWPDLNVENGWHEHLFQEFSQTNTAFDVSFNQEIDPNFQVDTEFISLRSGIINAVKLTGKINVFDQLVLGETVALNGEKILPIAPTSVISGEAVRFSIKGVRGSSGGLSNLMIQHISP